ncbi:MAG: 2Fe-2S iron-sulfur cluster-binding protein [Pseudomonadota bacterium]
MITVHFINPDGSRKTVTGKDGKNLMQLAIANRVDDIAADCGGALTCATCHVYVQEPFATLLGGPSDEEDGMLAFTAAPRRANSRLSCQIMLSEQLDGLTVELPDTQY